MECESTASGAPPAAAAAAPFDLCVVGCGVAGALLLGLLPDAALSPGRTLLVDPAFCGGDLGVVWGAVQSNTTAGAVAAALRRVPRWAAVPLPRLDVLPPAAASVPLCVVAEEVRALAAPLLSRVTAVCGWVEEVEEVAVDSSGGGGGFRIRVRDPSAAAAAAAPAAQAQARRVILCTGAVPRGLDFPVRALPLEVALDPARLPRHVQPGDRVVVFGLAHSGALVLANLRRCGAQVTGVYRGATPFLLARDGHYDGVKADAEEVVDAVMAGAWGADTPRLVRACDTATVLGALLRASAVVYATGFRTRAPRLLASGGAELRPDGFDPQSGALAGAPGLFGFGAGWPSVTVTPDGVTHADVGIPSFVGHMAAAVPAALAGLW